jgi:hypothetical protein
MRPEILIVAIYLNLRSSFWTTPMVKASPGKARIATGCRIKPKTAFSARVADN